jgi:integrase
MAATPAQAAELGRLLALRERLVKKGTPPNTARAYAGDWRRFEAWCRDVGASPLPTSGQVLQLYVAHLFDERRPPDRPGGRGGACKPSTVERALAAISTINQAQGHDSPLTDQLRKDMHQLRKGVKLQKHRAAPLLAEHLRVILAAMAKHQDALEVRDWAIVLLGWACALRRSELASLKMTNASVTNGKVLLTIEVSKTDQEGENEFAWSDPVEDESISPVTAFRQWVECRRGGQHLFCRSRGTKERRIEYAERMPDREVDDVVKRWTSISGIEPYGSGFGWSAHSLRAGFVTEAALQGWPEWKIMERTRHKDSDVLRGYIRLAKPLMRDQGKGLL